MKKADAARRVRSRLDERFAEFGASARFKAPPRGWMRAIREGLGMTTAQLAKRLGIKQPSVVALEQSEARGSIELATLKRVAAALDCTLVYALIPNKPLEAAVRARARDFLKARREPIEHSMLLENQAGPGKAEALDELLRETNPSLFWD
jgi:predicted DNA-binding mobile mystery protein A